MTVYHHSRDILCRSPRGAAPCASLVTLRLRGDDSTRSAKLRFYDGSEKWFPMEREQENWFSVTVRMPDIPILCWYDFRAEDESGKLLSYGGPGDGMGGEGQITDDPRAWQITVYDPAYDTPHWLREGIMYQIFPDRFYRAIQEKPIREEIYFHRNWNETPILMPEGGDDNCARDFFGGDLKGIQEKLPELKELGVTVLYLNPIFMARSNHRYDTTDYQRIDPMLGENEDFTALCQAAKAQGIRIMLDGVFSHNGEDSIYFNRFGRHATVGACQSTQSPYYPWYRFTRYPDEYECWWGFHTLPAVDKENESYRSFMFREDGIVRHWLKEGASGWRLDVADELTMRFLRSLRQAVKEQDPDATVLGEVWEDASHKVSYGEMRCYCQGDTLDSVMNYPLREAGIDFLTGRITAAGLEKVILSQQENYPLPFYYSLMNLAGSHDRPRAINTLCGRTWEELPQQQRGAMRLTDAEYDLGKKRYIELMKLLCALPGIPCVYYGDEVGLQGSADPFCRGTYPWGGGDQELKTAIQALLLQRKGSHALRTGTLQTRAPDKNTLLITREITGGRDVFGKAAENERITIEIRR